MGLLDNLSDLVKQAAGATGSEAELHGAFDQAAQSVPQGTLASGLAHVFNSDQTPPFGQMLGGLFNQSNPEQKAGLLNQIISALGPAVIGQIASSGGLGSLAGILTGGGNVTPQQAEQVSPEEVSKLGQHAANANPGIVEMAAGFYAQHPALIKSIGAGALALIMSRLSKR